VISSVIVKPPKILVSICIGLGIFTFQSLHAGVFDDIFDAANGALPGYGREIARSNRQNLSEKEIDSALREALIVGVNNVWKRLSEENGYANDTTVRIPLPDGWEKAREISSRIGYSVDFDRLEEQLNRAAESTAPATSELLQKAIRRLTIDDARGLLNANNTQATDYLRRRVSDRLESELRPVMVKSLQAVGALDFSSKIASRIRRVAKVSSLDVDLSDHVVSRSLDGFFYYLGKEEKAIRTFPESRTTELLRKVFG